MTSVFLATSVIRIASPVIVPLRAAVLLFVIIRDVVLACQTLAGNNARHVKPVITNILSALPATVIHTVQSVSHVITKDNANVPITLIVNNVTCARKDSTTIQRVRSVIVTQLA